MYSRCPNNITVSLLSRGTRRRENEGWQTRDNTAINSGERKGCIWLEVLVQSPTELTKVPLNGEGGGGGLGSPSLELAKA